jgi:hypothetical protein
MVLKFTNYDFVYQAMWPLRLARHWPAHSLRALRCLHLHHLPEKQNELKGLPLSINAQDNRVTGRELALRRLTRVASIHVNNHVSRPQAGEFRRRIRQNARDDREGCYVTSFAHSEANIVAPTGNWCSARIRRNSYLLRRQVIRGQNRRDQQYDRHSGCTKDHGSPPDDVDCARARSTPQAMTASGGEF